MLNIVYFISPEYIKKYYSGYLEQNIDDDSINTFILTAQDVHIQSVIGYDLYNKYISDINTYGSPQGTQYVYLMNNYIQKAVALWTLYEALPNLDTKITNKGVVNKNSEWSNTADKTRVERILNQLANNAEFYSQRIREYITNYPGDFPEYYYQTGVNRIKAQNNNYFGGVWLPDIVVGNNNGRQLDRYNRCCNEGNGFYLY